MSGITDYQKKIVLPYLLHLVCVILILLTAGCGDNSTTPATGDNNTADASHTGSATFSVQWQTDNAVSASAADAPARSAIGDCSAVGIESITCVVYDPSNNPNNPIANGGPWKCTDGGANMAVIPEGSNLTFAILGWDTDLELDGAEGNIIYQGISENPVTIVAGETTDAGEIVANPFVPTALAATAVSTSQIELTWRDMGASSYHIYQDGTDAATSTSPSFSITGLTQNTEYCFTVLAVDVFDNESGQSIEDCATTGSDDDTQAPTIPTSVNAVAVSENQIDISWVESIDNIGVSGYRIYDLEGQLLGTTTEPPFSHEGLQVDTEYCYTVVAFDTADNVSDRSAEVCATPEAIITVNIDSDFRYVGQGSPMGLSAGETFAAYLSYEPLEANLIEPPYGDLYEQYSTRYGYFEMGNSQDSIISFVIVEDHSSTTPERYRLYIDSNNNEDLTDDGAPHLSQGTTDFAVQVPLIADIITDSGDQITRPYQLWMWLVDNAIVRFYATCHYAGEIRAGGQTFTAVAFESFNHNALYRENGLFIDMDNDGRIDPESESFRHKDMVTVGSQAYELILDYP